MDTVMASKSKYSMIVCLGHWDVGFRYCFEFRISKLGFNQVLASCIEAGR
jgi:hypothetical protein